MSQNEVFTYAFPHKTNHSFNFLLVLKIKFIYLKKKVFSNLIITKIFSYKFPKIWPQWAQKDRDSGEHLEIIIRNHDRNHVYGPHHRIHHTIRIHYPVKKLVNKPIYSLHFHKKMLFSYNPSTNWMTLGTDLTVMAK